MIHYLALIFALLLSATSFAAGVIEPQTFENIWLQNNQKNLIKRYHERSVEVKEGELSIWHLDLDSAPSKIIKTSAGDHDALFSRMGIHYQSWQYLFLVDWLSVIPQPQTTEGFYYGDLVIGRTWQLQKYDSDLTLGIRNRTRPKTTTVNNETVFNLTSNASSDDLSLFVHLNLRGYDVGSYYSSKYGNSSTSLFIPIFKNNNHRLSSSVGRFNHPTDIAINDYYDISVSYQFNYNKHQMNSDLSYQHIDEGNSGLNNAFIIYKTPLFNPTHIIAGLYYFNDLQNSKTHYGEKLGVEFPLSLIDSSKDTFTIGVYYRKNTYGDYSALVLEDEPIWSFNITGTFEAF